MFKQLSAANKNHQVFLITGMCLFLLFFANIVFAQDKTPLPGIKSQNILTPNIITIDMPYDLFVALASYHELSEAEKQGESINKDIIPVLEDIVKELAAERNKYKQISAEHKLKTRMEDFLNKMEKHRLGFYNELVYRKKVFQFNELLNKQNQLIKQGE